MLASNTRTRITGGARALEQCPSDNPILTRMGASKQYTAEEMAEALREEGGVVTRAADRVGCHPETVYRYADEYVTVERALNAGRQQTYANAEDKLVQAIEQGERWAIERALENYGEKIDDGIDWSKRERKEVKQDGEVTFNVKYESADGD